MTWNDRRYSSVMVGGSFDFAELNFSVIRRKQSTDFAFHYTSAGLIRRKVKLLKSMTLQRNVSSLQLCVMSKG